MKMWMLQNSMGAEFLGIVAGAIFFAVLFVLIVRFRWKNGF